MALENFPVTTGTNNQESFRTKGDEPLSREEVLKLAALIKEMQAKIEYLSQLVVVLEKSRKETMDMLLRMEEEMASEDQLGVAKEERIKHLQEKTRLSDLLLTAQNDLQDAQKQIASLKKTFEEAGFNVPERLSGQIESLQNEIRTLREDNENQKQKSAELLKAGKHIFDKDQRRIAELENKLSRERNKKAPVNIEITDDKDIVLNNIPLTTISEKPSFIKKFSARVKGFFKSL
jgi:chromosome segregation ATPase